ncbi:MAG: galactose mutarotase [Oscillospiraceae bacterium]|nr:galactose mutarotase [Oscillospiraceae bacterium]
MTPFGSFDGKQVDCIRLENGRLSCEVLTYGATLRALRFPDRNGKALDLVLGFDSLEDYVNHECYFGATIGPVANRIAGAACPLNGKTLRLNANEGPNCLHSGEAGLDRKLWEPLAVSEEAVTLLCTHPDGLGGIPGELRVAGTYWLDEDALLVEYRAVSDRDTLCNLTNHSYFNLDGHDSGSVLDHRVCLHAKSFTPLGPGSIPTGSIRAVSGSAMDLTKPVRLGERIDADCEQLRLAGGFDHNYVIDADAEGFRAAAEVWGARSGIKLAVYTDRPGVQFYTGNYIPAGLRGKDGAVYGPRQGLCLETQGFPDAPNHESFPPIALRAGREWISRTLFKFSVQ